MRQASSYFGFSIRNIVHGHKRVCSQDDLPGVPGSHTKGFFLTQVRNGSFGAKGRVFINVCDINIKSQSHHGEELAAPR